MVFRAFPLVNTNTLVHFRWHTQLLASHPTPRLLPRRWITTAQEVENTNVNHSRFLAEASSKTKWNDRNADNNVGKGGTEATAEDFDSTADGKDAGHLHS